ncbi:MAG: hypothetical protein CMJ35_12735 [Phycisphaerae bacterium]|nr:hypothetical protein [Phycisphaerae bacterium]MBM92459.1 hypothetical protein [Phycisphaerae bacterium]
MTSAQTMLTTLTLALVVCLAPLMGGCSMTKSRDELSPPGVIVSPYDTGSGDVLWAVIPPLNESGTSIADPSAIGDSIVAAAQGVRGVRCLPINRSLDALQTLGLFNGIESSSDAHKLAEYMGCDAVLVGSITAYDPYDPPVLGLALALYARPGAMAQTSQAQLDSRALTMAFSDFGTFDGLTFAGEPVSVVSEHLDARNHEVQYAVRSYAQGRSDRSSALQWRIYLASMDLYTQFAAHHTIGRLIDQEWLRLAEQSARRRQGN